MKVDFFRSEIFGKIFGHNKYGSGIICVPCQKIHLDDTYKNTSLQAPIPPMFFLAKKIKK